MESRMNESCLTFSQINMIYNARIFWRRFTTWIREYFISRYMGIGTAEDSFGRLYLEATDFGEMLRIIFGRNASNSFANLMRRFTIGLRELVSAQLKGDTEAVGQHVDDLYQITGEIAAFLASVNPYLDEAEWSSMLDTYLRYTMEEANLFVSPDYSRGIEILDQLTELTNRMGDLFAKALYDYVTSGKQCEDGASSGLCVTYDDMNKIYEIRMLWFDLATWIRAYMISRYTGRGDPDALVERLRKVLLNYTNMLRSLIGEGSIQEGFEADRNLWVVNRFIDLITAVVSAHMSNDPAEINRLTQLIYETVDQMASFLATVNPFWSEEEWKTRLYDITKNTINESTAFLTGNYALSLDIFSTILDQAESISDYYAQGLFRYILGSRSGNTGTKNRRFES